MASFQEYYHLVTRKFFVCLTVTGWQPHPEGMGMVKAPKAIPKLRLRLPPFLDLFIHSIVIIS